MVKTTVINTRSKLFRVTGPEGLSLWYDQNGQWTGKIHTLQNAAAANLPMDFNPIFKAEGSHWLSCTDELHNLERWFSHDDMIELMKRGYHLLEIEVEAYRRLHFDEFSHEVFRNEDVVSKRQLDPMHFLYLTTGVS